MDGIKDTQQGSTRHEILQHLPNEIQKRHVQMLHDELFPYIHFIENIRNNAVVFIYNEVFSTTFFTVGCGGRYEWTFLVRFWLQLHIFLINFGNNRIYTFVLQQNEVFPGFISYVFVSFVLWDKRIYYFREYFKLSEWG